MLKLSLPKADAIDFANIMLKIFDAIENQPLRLIRLIAIGYRLAYDLA